MQISQEQRQLLTKRLAELESRPGVLEDVGKSALAAVPKAAMAAPLWLADVGNLVASGGVAAYKGLHNMLSESPLTQEQVKRLDTVKPFYGSQDAIQGAEKLTGIDLYDPKTRAGKFTDTALQFALGNKVAGGTAKTGAIAGLTSEAAGQATEGTKYEAPARFIGAIAGGTVADRNSILRSNAGTQANQALKGVSQSQIDEATQLINNAKSVGISLTTAEALAQVTNNPKQPLLSLQRSVEGSPNTASRMGDFMAKRPVQNQSAMDDYMTHGIGEPVNYPAIPAQTQKTAEQVVKGVENQRTTASSPYYQSANPVAIPQQPLADMVTRIEAAAKAAPQAIKLHLQQLASDIKTSDGTVEGLDTIRKLYRDKINAPQIDAKSLEKAVGVKVSPFVEELDALLVNASPYFAQGKAVYQAMTPDVNAVNASPVGKLARSNPEAQNAVISQFDDLVRSDSARPQDVAEAVKRLAAVNPEAPQNLLAAGLRIEWEKATKALQSGDNQMGGANFAKSVGTDKVRAGLGALPGGAEALKGFDLLMDAFGAQGKRLGVGSPTAEKGFLQRQMEKGGVVGAISRPLGTVSDAVSDWRSGKANEQLLEVMTSPDGIAKLQELAKVGANNPRGQALLRSMMLGAKGNEMGQIEQEQPLNPQMREMLRQRLRQLEAAPLDKPTAPQNPAIQSPQSNAAPLLQRIAKAESNNNPEAKAKTSTAVGRYQFTKPTWEMMVKKYGKQTGITMADRTRDDAQHTFAKLLTRDNGEYLQNRLGRMPTEDELYMAHFLGPKGAGKLIEHADTNKIAAALFPEAAKANRSIFYKGNRPRTTSEVYQVLAGKV